MGRSFVSCLVICFFLQVSNAQDIKLCPSAGPLHLPPPGCALRKNFVEDQNCFTIGVVCKDGQEGGGGSTAEVPAEGSTTTTTTGPITDIPFSTGGAVEVFTGAASPSSEVPPPSEATTLPPPPPSTEASIDSGTQNVNKPEAFCPIYNATEGAECGQGQRDCTNDNGCGSTELCCHDVPCNKKVCKAKLLPCPSQDEIIPGACALKNIVDTERNCVLTVGDCPSGVTTGTGAGASEGTTTVVVAPSETPTPTPTAGGESPSTEALPPTAGIIDANVTTGAPVSEEITTPISSSEVPTDSTIPPPVEVKPPQSANATCPARDPNVQPNPANCDQSQKKCNDDSECAANELCCADDDCEASICKKSSSIFQVVPPIPGSEIDNSTQTTAVTSDSLAVSEGTPGVIDAGTGAPTSTPAHHTCPPRDLSGIPDLSLCDRTLTNCSDDAECGVGELCCADDNCEITVCKKALLSAESTESSTPQGTEPAAGSTELPPPGTDSGSAVVQPSIDATPQPQEKNETAVEGTTTNVTPSIAPDNPDTTAVPPVSNSSTGDAAQPPPTDLTAVTLTSSSNQTSAPKFCPVQNETVPADSGLCDKSQKPCLSTATDGECSVTEVCCQDYHCGGTYCKAALLPCPPGETQEANAEVKTNCQPVVDKERNCVAQSCT